jgi:hypothetical protein
MPANRRSPLYTGIALLALAVLVKVVAEAAIWYELRQNPGTDNFRVMTIEFWAPYPVLILGILGAVAITYFVIRWLIRRNSA